MGYSVRASDSLYKVSKEGDFDGGIGVKGKMSVISFIYFDLLKYIYMEILMVQF